MTARITSALLLLFIFLAGFRENKPVIPCNNKWIQLNTTDTIFTANPAEGWTVFSYYLQNSGDSIDFELILSRNTPTPVDWTMPSYAGMVSSAYIPSKPVYVNYKDPTRTWQIALYTDGRCYLNLINGPWPKENPAFICFQTKFKY